MALHFFLHFLDRNRRKIELETQVIGIFRLLTLVTSAMRRTRKKKEDGTVPLDVCSGGEGDIDSADVRVSERKIPQHPMRHLVGEALGLSWTVSRKRSKGGGKWIRKKRKREMKARILYSAPLLLTLVRRIPFLALERTRKEQTLCRREKRGRRIPEGIENIENACSFPSPDTKILPPAEYIENM